MDIFISRSGGKRVPRRWPNLILGAVLGATVALGSTALASDLAATSTVIHACYARSGGALRYVPAGSRCRSSESPLSWNQAGPRGPRGLRGLRGLIGSQGPPGNLGILNPLHPPPPPPSCPPHTPDHTAPPHP